MVCPSLARRSHPPRSLGARALSRPVVRPCDRVDHDKKYCRRDDALIAPAPGTSPRCGPRRSARPGKEELGRLVMPDSWACLRGSAQAMSSFLPRHRGTAAPPPSACKPGSLRIAGRLVGGCRPAYRGGAISPLRCRSGARGVREEQVPRERCWCAGSAPLRGLITPP